VRTFPKQGVEWCFLTKHAPWFRGFCKTLIGLTKPALKKILHARPTHVSADVNPHNSEDTDMQN